MRNTLSSAIGVLCLAIGPLGAQWIHYPTAGVPKTAQGKPNMNAPTPRMPDGKPDFSGMWWNAGPEQDCPEFLGGKNDCAEKGLGLSGQAGGALPAQARNIALGLEGGLPYQPWALELQKQRLANSMSDPHVHCLPSGLVRGYTLPHVQKILQTKTEVAMLNEFNASYRQIFLDGRALPVDPIPSWNGYSTAKWDRDTLVVQTIGFRDDLWLDMSGNPMTGSAKLMERIRRPNFGTLEIQLTVDDLKAYTKPWTVTIKQFLVLDTELMDEICLENEQSTKHIPAAK